MGPVHAAYPQSLSKALKEISMTLQFLTPEIIDQLDDEQLRAIANGTLEVELLEYKGEGLNTLRARRDELRAAGENTVRLDAEIAWGERNTQPVLFFTQKMAA
ncbi:hypothetical protein HOU00_gp076 [Caulobacter phage CcrPW]|uniref:Uncharacterized protein n=1 Tax=Caulobacter phage CcrPW TaxID=2283271 RepID=A0A385EC84_9CAUD|nr:hypothetical protein HOU00_gp076 [Caulobacter phage CcrPW]AXQ68615.1 hypothetical protein CcrPW_gp076 [Caulobacter phage CcrPW]